MTPASPSRSALVLMSGGLDSMLAACVLRAQEIAVTGLCFESPFFSAEKARSAAQQIGVPLVVEDFSEALIALVEHPPHGFGAGINPCIDCHAAMIRRAGQLLARDGFDFIATGEVLNQRPMSQTRRNLDEVAHDSGLKDRLLRPLSARMLPETEPERLGWVDRAQLLSLNGRGRKPQYELAKRFGITSYPSSAGGCKLTEPQYAEKLWDLRRNGGLRDRRAIALLRLGRHFRLSPRVKAIIGRDQGENTHFETTVQAGEILLATLPLIAGPTIVVTGPATPSDIEMAARLCARYSDVRTAPRVTIVVRQGGAVQHLDVEPATELDVERLKI